MGYASLNGEAYQRNLQKAHPWAERRHMTYRSSKSVHRCDLCAWRRGQKRQRKKLSSGKLAIRRDHPRFRIEMKFCMVGGLQMVVLSFEFHRNRLSGFGAVGVKIFPSPLTWPLAYTTACTTSNEAFRSAGTIHCTDGVNSTFSRQISPQQGFMTRTFLLQ